MAASGDADVPDEEDDTDINQDLPATETVTITDGTLNPSEEWLRVKAESEKMHGLIKDFNEQAMESLYSQPQQNISCDTAI